MYREFTKPADSIKGGRDGDLTLNKLDLQLTNFAKRQEYRGLKIIKHLKSNLYHRLKIY